MLINFSFSNFKSFRDPQQFSMERDAPGAGGKAEISRVAAVYGANASGKSNFFEAIRSLTNMILKSFRDGSGDFSLDVSPFLLNGEHADEPTDFLMEAKCYDGLKYRYYVSVTASEVLEERLQVYKSRRPALVFERRAGEDGTPVVKVGSTYPSSMARLTDLTRPNCLFLSVALAAGTEATKPFLSFVQDIGWFDASFYGAEIISIKDVERNDPKLIDALNALVPFADFGIDGMEVVTLDDSANTTDVPDEDKELREFLRTFDIDRRRRLMFHHAGTSGGALLSEKSESTGTLGAVAFFSVALQAILGGRTMVVDEIENGLHPILVRELVSLFADPTTNPSHAQLIFTSHDASLITAPAGADRILDRDQIWFVSKDGSGASDLVPATSYGVKKDENIGRNYLNGVYGAVPRPQLHEAFGRALAVLSDEAGDDAAS